MGLAMIARAPMTEAADPQEEPLFRRLAVVFVVAAAVFYLAIAVVWKAYYDEIDSNVLPLVALQYRGSLIVTQTDIDRARVDFPSAYRDVRSYADLHSAKLAKIDEDHWAAYYFPAYPIFCLPFKVLFQAAGLPQLKAFVLANLVLWVGALVCVLRRLRAPAEKRLASLLVLVASHSVFYVNYVNYEVFMMAFVTASLVEHYNRNFMSSALLLSIAGIPNPAVMAVGIVMILSHCGRLFLAVRRGRAVAWGSMLWQTVRYGACFLPCLIPFAFNLVYLGGATGGFGAVASFADYPCRVWTYFLDPTVGFPSFGGAVIGLLFVLTGAAFVARRWRAVEACAFLVVAVLSVSLMHHVNCGMFYAARYLVWIYPFAATALVFHALDLVAAVRTRRLLVLLCVGSAVLLVGVNMGVRSYEFNRLTRLLLEYAPGLYNPYSATFYSRTLHIDGGYDQTSPVAYCDPGTGEVRKIIYLSRPGAAIEVEGRFTGDERSMRYLRDALAGDRCDGRFRYINASGLGSVKLWQKH